MRCLVAVAVSALLLAGLPLSVSAAGGSVARYKRHVNSLCVATTPKLVKSARAIKRASTKAEFVTAFERYVAIGLQQDKAILRLPVPSTARTQMAPFLRLTHQGDALVRQMTSALKAGKQALFNRLAAQSDALGKKYDRVADALGLRGCGSEQTRALDRV